MIRALLPAVQNGFVLALVVRATEREGVLGPDDERGPLAARLDPGLLQGVQLRGAHGHVAAALGDHQQVHAGHRQ